jgi:nucleosome binding factor SPN SPT16 subunit
MGLNLDFSFRFAYNENELGGVQMNEFEQNVQSKRNDAIDAGMGFVVSFGFFAAIFVIAVIVDFIA